VREVSGASLRERLSERERTLILAILARRVEVAPTPDSAVLA